MVEWDGGRWREWRGGKGKGTINALVFHLLTSLPVIITGTNQFHVLARPLPLNPHLYWLLLLLQRAPRLLLLLLLRGRLRLHLLFFLGRARFRLAKRKRDAAMHVLWYESTMWMAPEHKALHLRRLATRGASTSERARRRILQRRTGEMRVLPTRLLHLGLLLLRRLELLQLRNNVRRCRRYRLWTIASSGIDGYPTGPAHLWDRNRGRRLRATIWARHASIGSSLAGREARGR